MCSEILKYQGLPAVPDATAPDGSEIRFLPDLQTGGKHRPLLVATSSEIKSRLTQDSGEIWHFLSGTGEVWRSLAGHETVAEVSPGNSLNIPLGAKFQFRNSGTSSLQFLIITSPRWPGADEASRETDYWPID